MEPILIKSFGYLRRGVLLNNLIFLAIIIFRIEEWIKAFNKYNVSNIDLNALDYYWTDLFMVMSE